LQSEQDDTQVISGKAKYSRIGEDKFEIFYHDIHDSKTECSIIGEKLVLYIGDEDTMIFNRTKMDTADIHGEWKLMGDSPSAILLYLSYIKKLKEDYTMKIMEISEDGYIYGLMENYLNGNQEYIKICKYSFSPLGNTLILIEEQTQQIVEYEYEIIGDYLVLFYEFISSGSFGDGTIKNEVIRNNSVFKKIKGGF